MFIVSLKANKKKMLLALGAAVLAITLLLAALKLGRSATEIDPFDCRAGTNEERIAFLHQFGWEAEIEPIDLRDVTIPVEFDEVYQKYNALQKSQGLDLSLYPGKTCKLYVYAVTNYPGEEKINATLLVLNGRVIGGDLSSPELNGFMCGFYGQTEGASSASASAPAESLPASSALDALGGASAEQSGQEPEAVSSSEIPANAWPTD